jgi:hypothetical protein
MKIFFTIFTSFVTCLAVSSLLAQTGNSGKSSAPVAPPLGLPRLAPSGAVTPVPVLAAGKFAVDDLATTGAGASKEEKKGVDYVALDPAREWTRPLRGSGKDVQFVSFSVHASLSTIVRIGDAWLALIDGLSAKYAQLMVGRPGRTGIDWQPLNIHLPLAPYGGKSFAALQTSTVRLDPQAGTWDLYIGSRLVAENLPFYTPVGKANSKELSIQPGKQGAWVIGLVQSDENPLFEDANANGIDDRFEQQHRGALLAADAPAADRTALIKAWRAYTRTHPTPVPAVKRILPDRF